MIMVREMIVGLKVSRYVTVAYFFALRRWKQSMMEFPSSILVTQKQNHGEWKCLRMTIGL